MRMHGRAAQAAGVAATRPALWQGTPHMGRRHYRLMRDHLTPVPQSLLTQLVQMPEVAFAHFWRRMHLWRRMHRAAGPCGALQAAC